MEKYCHELLSIENKISKQTSKLIRLYEKRAELTMKLKNKIKKTKEKANVD